MLLRSCLRFRAMGRQRLGNAFDQDLKLVGAASSDSNAHAAPS
jgi:hypothetical protein